MVTKINNCSPRSNTVMMKQVIYLWLKSDFYCFKSSFFFPWKSAEESKNSIEKQEVINQNMRNMCNSLGSEVLNLAWKSKNAVFITFSYLLSSFFAKVKIVISKPLKYQNMVFILLVTVVPQFYLVPKIFLLFSIKGYLFWDIYHNATFLEG